MQQDDKTLQFMKAVGAVFKDVREEETHNSINKFAREYDIDRGNLSKIERGIINCRLITAWKLSEAAGIKFSEFAKRLEEKLGKDFILMDE
uniref:HTH cro/C1-type domain-containing protein n=1 Tax=uncultured Candidatus Melainabacteria bacterium TaxID=2682970 RepID=A0A650EKF5_9BACT|nr:hypothetical protein Melaina855_0880 [uncultured Candidatus Melainabacteria bacterium]